MYIIEVIPLTLLPPNAPQILSYFFNLELQKGAIVEILLNKRVVKAVVLSSSSLEKEKLALKKVDFQIKKLTKVLYDQSQVSDYQLKIASWLAKYYHAPLGYTLKTILPSFAFKKKFPVTAPITTTSLIHRPTSQVGYVNYPTETRLRTGPSQNQFWVYKTKGLADHLKSLITETLNKPKQVLILTPEKTTIDYFAQNLPTGANHAIVFSGLPNTKQYETWQRARSGETSVTIGTRQALNMPFSNLGLIIVDDPNNEAYKSEMIPRYNAVRLAKKIAELNNAQLVLTSVIPSVEDYYYITNKNHALKNLESRPKFDTEIIDATQEIKNGNWSPLSKKFNEELIASLRNGKRVLVFSSRRGYAGIILCGNCGSAIKCGQCDVAMRTHRSVELMLVCHHCGASKPIPKNCPVCGNYNLKTVGSAGTQKIYDEIKFSLATAGIKSPVLVLDTDIVKNETEEEEIISEISKPPSTGGSVLIATQMIFSHRFRLNFDLIGIVNADALMNMPDFRSEENFFYQTEKLINFNPRKLLIQTYNPENKLIEKAARGDYAEFYNGELKLRKALNYPPFYKLIRLSFKHKNKDKASYAARITTEKLKMAVARANLGEIIKIVEAAPAYIEKEKGLYIYNIFLKVKEGYQDINDLLKYAGPGWIVDVEPRSLL